MSAAYTVGFEPGQITLRQVDIPITGLPPALNGLKIGQLSDPHRCPFVPHARVERAVALLADEKPDLVALTGDFVSYWPDYAAEYSETLAPLRPELGLFACLGNHDHWTDPDWVASALQAAGVTVLRNQHQVVSLDGAHLCIVGIDDIGDTGISLHRTGPADDLPAALADSPLSGVIRILLAHNPDLVMEPVFAKETAKRLIHLVLSGHTHGGQVSLPLIGPPFLSSRYGQLFSGGLVRAAGTRVYVSRGAGSSWPVRFNCPPEVNMLTLRSV
jgi:predicted MPP superfamily phosphohydrolase